VKALHNCSKELHDSHIGDEEWKDGRLEKWKNETIRRFDNRRMECWNVDALAEIPLRREKIGRLEWWNGGRGFTTETLRTLRKH